MKMIRGWRAFLEGASSGLPLKVIFSRMSTSDIFFYSGLLEGDARYRGKKGSRRTLDQDLDDGPLDQDMKEHMQAELGHMFGGDDDDDEEDEEDDEGHQEEDEDDEEEESEDEDGDEDEEDETGEDEDEIMEEDERVEKKGLVEEKPGEFSFNPNTAFGEYGDDMEEDSEDEDDDKDENDEPNNEDSEEESDEDEDDHMEEEEEGPVKPGALMREKQNSDKVKASAVVEQLATWDSLLEQRILLQKLLTRVSTFPHSLGTFVEGKEHEKEVKVAEKAVEKVVRSSGEVSRLLPGGEGEPLQAGDSETVARRAKKSKAFFERHM